MRRGVGSVIVLMQCAFAVAALPNARAADGAVERAQAAGLNGALYAEIAPTFNGSDGNVSYLRLGNGSATASTYTVTVVGSPSGAVYGTASFQIPPSASPQYSLSQILTAANAGALASGDVSYSLYLQNSGGAQSYQHVIYNAGNGFFENMSTCKYVASANYTGLNSKLLNVHTTQIAAYPDYVAVHNYAPSAVTYSATVYDSATGTLIGVVQLAIGAGVTFFQPFSWFQQQLNWTPASSQLHASIVFAATGTAPYEAEVSQYVFNQQFSAYVDMSQRCGISTAAP